MAEFGCCKRAGQRVYYLIMAIMYGVTLVIEIVTLGTFGVQFSQTRSFWNDHVTGSSQICVLYGGGSSDRINPSLGNSASCGFTLWGLVSVIIVLVVWTIFHIIMAIMGRPKITSRFRIIDLIMASLMAFLSLVISAVLTGGLTNTCKNTPGSGQTCRSKQFTATMNGGKPLDFFRNLDAAKDTSWTVTIVFVLLIGWYTMLLVMHCCISKYRKEEELEQAAADRKKTKELPDVTEDEVEQKEKFDEAFEPDNEEQPN